MNHRNATLAAAVTVLLLAASARADIPGTTGTAFALTAKTGHISTPDGNSILIWGFTDNATGRVQYPAPTLILDQGNTITVELTNTLDVPVSIVFPGQTSVTAEAVSGPTQNGLLTLEAGTSGTVRYTFVASRPGTYHYHSGTRPDLQVEVGLVGAIIIRPTGFDHMNMKAYEDDATTYTHEFLFLLTEMDPRIHELVEKGEMNQIDNTTYFPVNWFINGRCAPDTMAPSFAGWLPAQPYNCMPMMNPGERLLMRVIGAGRHLHPFHHHGNHAKIIAKDGRLLTSGLGNGPDLGFMVFTIQTAPGETVDAIFEWTGAGMGWDIYGHTSTDTMTLEPHEYAPDHGKPFPVQLPEKQDLTFGGFYSGSPFLGTLGALPPGEGGMNPNAGFVYMWHSHTEKEMTNNNIFPGGLMTMLIIEPPFATGSHH